MPKPSWALGRCFAVADLGPWARAMTVAMCITLRAGKPREVTDPQSVTLSVTLPSKIRILVGEFVRGLFSVRKCELPGPGPRGSSFGSRCGGGGGGCPSLAGLLADALL